jgi:hypothetical protein
MRKVVVTELSLNPLAHGENLLFLEFCIAILLAEYFQYVVQSTGGEIGLAPISLAQSRLIKCSVSQRYQNKMRSVNLRIVSIGL